MAFKIIWSPQAIADLDSPTAFIARDNPGAAEKTGWAILDKTRNLETFPLIGRVVPERKKADVREVFHGPFRIIYRVQRKRGVVEVLRVWHAARGTPSL
jgi:plasmid stabilization system protein ParE